MTQKRYPLARQKKPIAAFSTKGRKRKQEEGKAMREFWESGADHAGGRECIECSKYLREYSAFFVHHVLPKGRYLEHQSNKNNFVVLCSEHHIEIETGNAKDMKCYLIIEEIKSKYT